MVQEAVGNRKKSRAMTQRPTITVANASPRSMGLTTAAAGGFVAIALTGAGDAGAGA